MGVPVVAQNDWGWREMIEHGVTGFLGSDDCELAHFAAMLAHDEELRLQIARNARHRIETELADPQTLWTKWQTLFRGLWLRESAHSSWPSLVEYEEEAARAGGEMNQ